jgi:hypothetical protein
VQAVRPRGPVTANSDIKSVSRAVCIERECKDLDLKVNTHKVFPSFNLRFSCSGSVRLGGGVGGGGAAEPDFQLLPGFVAKGGNLGEGGNREGLEGEKKGRGIREK